jgi:peptide deformylase
MPLSIINYPHPVLRHKSRPITKVDSELKSMIAEMFDLMYERKGVGLAANQVNLPLRLFIANPSGERGEGEEFVFINPVLSKGKGNEEAEEGCLSLPGVNANVKRNRSVFVSAYSLEGVPIEQMFDGFMARIIQHETDHLEGTMFIDRLSDQMQRDLSDQLEEFILEHQSRQDRKQLPSDDELRAQLAQWESKYC